MLGTWKNLLTIENYLLLRNFFYTIVIAYSALPIWFWIICAGMPFTGTYSAHNSGRHSALNVY